MTRNDEDESVGVFLTSFSGCNMLHPQMSQKDLVDGINQGITRSIQTSGEVLPSSSILSSVCARCQWTDYATNPLKVDGVPLCLPVVEDLKHFFPPLSGREVGSDGRTMLYAACLGLLLSTRETSANADQSDSTRFTPFSIFLSIASFLLDDIGVDPNEPTQNIRACRRPPLHLVARSCYPLAVSALLERGADPYLKDDEGWTSLMACCLPDIPSCEEGGPKWEERRDTVRILLKGMAQVGAPVDVDARNYCGYGALHYACEGLNSCLVECLLEGQAKATLRTIWGQSCLGIVRMQRDNNADEAAKCEEILLSYLESNGENKFIDGFLQEEKKALELVDLIEKVLIPASRQNEDARHRSPGVGLPTQDERIISALMIHLELDPSLLFDDTSFKNFPHQEGNLYEVLHRRVLALIPDSFIKVYRDCHPTSDEMNIISSVDFRARRKAEIMINGKRHVDLSILTNQLFCLHRERGQVARHVEILTDVIVNPLQRVLAFGIPSNVVLRKIVAIAPRIVEVGAGTGYWSYLLSTFGADVIAYDANPPCPPDNNQEGDFITNIHVAMQSYFDIIKGNAHTAFGIGRCVNSDRALLMVWPNNPDAKDNPHVGIQISKLPPIWDLECLKTYYDSGGSLVIYVGEREEKIELMANATSGDCGFCASRNFQLFLQKHFELEATFECPRWWMKEDDVTIWRRKRCLKRMV